MTCASASKILKPFRTVTSLQPDRSPLSHPVYCWTNCIEGAGVLSTRWGGGRVSQGIRRPWDAVDYDEIVRLFPPAPDYFATSWFDDPDPIARTQLPRLQARARQAYRV